MKICTNCGRECDNTLKVCPKCGWGLKDAKVIEEGKTVTEIVEKTGVYGEKVKLKKKRKITFYKTNSETIAKNEGYFKVYLYLPLICAILTALSFLILGIIDAANGGILVRYSVAGSLFAWWGIGVLSTIVAYWLMKLSLAPLVLHIYYQKEMLRKLNEIK